MNPRAILVLAAICFFGGCKGTKNGAKDTSPNQSSDDLAEAETSISVSLRKYEECKELQADVRAQLITMAKNHYEQLEWTKRKGKMPSGARAGSAVAPSMDPRPWRPSVDERFFTQNREVVRTARLLVERYGEDFTVLDGKSAKQVGTIGARGLDRAMVQVQGDYALLVARKCSDKKAVCDDEAVEDWQKQWTPIRKLYHFGSGKLTEVSLADLPLDSAATLILTDSSLIVAKSTRLPFGDFAPASWAEGNFDFSFIDGLSWEEVEKKIPESPLVLDKDQTLAGIPCDAITGLKSHGEGLDYISDNLALSMLKVEAYRLGDKIARGAVMGLLGGDDWIDIGHLNGLTYDAARDVVEELPSHLYSHIRSLTWQPWINPDDDVESRRSSDALDAFSATEILVRLNLAEKRDGLEVGGAVGLPGKAETMKDLPDRNAVVALTEGGRLYAIKAEGGALVRGQGLDLDIRPDRYLQRTPSLVRVTDDALYVVDVRNGLRAVQIGEDAGLTDLGWVSDEAKVLFLESAAVAAKRMAAVICKGVDFWQADVTGKQPAGGSLVLATIDAQDPLKLKVEEELPLGTASCADAQSLVYDHVHGIVGSTNQGALKIFRLADDGGKLQEVATIDHQNLARDCEPAIHETRLRDEGLASFSACGIKLTDPAKPGELIGEFARSGDEN